MPPTSEQACAVVAPAPGVAIAGSAAQPRPPSVTGNVVASVVERGDAVPSDIRSAARGLDQSSIMAAELIAALLTWSGIGWLLDWWLGTGPWLLAIGALVGNAAGIYLIWLRSGRMEGFDGMATRLAHREGEDAGADTAPDPTALVAMTGPSDGADER